MYVKLETNMRRSGSVCALPELWPCASPRAWLEVELSLYLYIHPPYYCAHTFHHFLDSLITTELIENHCQQRSAPRDPSTHPSNATMSSPFAISTHHLHTSTFHTQIH